MFVCQAFGWCPNGTKCPLSHDTDRIIFQDEKNKDDKRKKRKRQREKKRSEGEGSSIFDGSPENKIPNMEVDPEDPPGNQRGTVAETPQSEGKSLATDSKGNSVCDENITTASIDDSRNTKNNTNDGKSGKVSGTGAGREKTNDRSAGIETQKKNADAGTHRAGFDAFMTGYIFAYSCTVIRKEEAGEADKEQEEEEQSWLPTCLNKVYLSGKVAPLNVVKSTFSKSSKAHMQKMEMVWGRRC